jgi:hypothetical protein
MIEGSQLLSVGRACRDKVRARDRDTLEPHPYQRNQWINNVARGLNPDSMILFISHWYKDPRSMRKPPIPSHHATTTFKTFLSIRSLPKFQARIHIYFDTPCSPSSTHDHQSINQSITTNPPPCRRPTTPAGTLSPAAAHWKSRSRDNRGCWRRCIPCLRSRLACRPVVVVVVVVAVVVIVDYTTSPMSDSRAIRSQHPAPLPEMMSGGLNLATPWKLRRWRDWGSDVALAAFAAIPPGVWRLPPCSIPPGVAFGVC